MRQHLLHSKPGWLAQILVHSGDSVFLFPVLILLVFLMPDFALELKFTLGALGATAVVVWLVKNAVKKPRPEGEYGQLYRKYDPYSFPSGHAARVFCLATLMAGIFGKTAVLLFIWAAAVSLTRIIYRLHDSTDLLVGLLIGSGVGVLTLSIFQ